MGSFHRRGGYSIFIPEIDAEHRTLFRLADELATALDAHKRLAHSELLQSLTTHIQHHFAHEERLMRASAYSALVWHKQQHDGSRRQVKRFVKRIEQGDREAGAELLQYLGGWLENHVLVTDRMMAAHLRNFERRRAA
ncbi:MAG: hemerythrin family protein [Bryobacteraceae bacterium]|jgi:hemerythrin-like metal-binding protein